MMFDTIDLLSRLYFVELRGVLRQTDTSGSGRSLPEWMVEVKPNPNLVFRKLGNFRCPRLPQPRSSRKQSRIDPKWVCRDHFGDTGHPRIAGKNPRFPGKYPEFRVLSVQKPLRAFFDEKRMVSACSAVLAAYAARTAVATRNYVSLRPHIGRCAL